jgi:hypothetical protein
VRTGPVHARCAALAAGLAIVPSILPGQRRAEGGPLAARVARARTPVVRLEFPSRADACGYGETIGLREPGGRGGSPTVTWGDTPSVRGDFRSVCEHGPVRLSIRRGPGGEVVALRARVGGTWEPAGDDVTDLGPVAAADAADYLLHLAATESGAVSERAVLPAALAEGVTVWPVLLAIARDRSRPDDTRAAARFWIFDAAAARFTGGLTPRPEDERSERSEAVFALSRLEHGAGVPALVEVARTHADPWVRRDALFWLTQEDDPRGLDLLEELLRR